MSGNFTCESIISGEVLQTRKFALLFNYVPWIVKASLGVKSLSGHYIVYHFELFMKLHRRMLHMEMMYQEQIVNFYNMEVLYLWKFCT